MKSYIRYDINSHNIRAFWDSRWRSPKTQNHADLGPKQKIRAMDLGHDKEPHKEIN